MRIVSRSFSHLAAELGAMGLKPTWAMRSECFSQRYTTHWSEIPTVKAIRFMQSSKSN
ncbi:DUF4113 domain-containing protein [Nodosilinea sp. LEGE 07088]|uniref:DUF4113 domain-containing protein n=1 Tax=Nodosilinea sp. LEGE 07088 TaxID=2777968 RepID=UPI0018815E5A|nr:DUF4113 domain-containing protein [Nodosilinea sp. LEGE 07088]MBE9140169.1 DUF4113 domain-containing protein [Nodosilinea sp. LEGE 07088]